MRERGINFNEEKGELDKTVLKGGRRAIGESMVCKGKKTK